MPVTTAAYEAANPAPDFGRLFRETVGLWCNAGPGNYPEAQTAAVFCPALILAGDGDTIVPRSEALALADRRTPLAVAAGGANTDSQRRREVARVLSGR